MTIVEDMSTTTNPRHHKGIARLDQENRSYPDIRIMPMSA